MATDASLRPNWIIQREVQKAQAASQAQLVATQKRLARVMIEKDSVQFCVDFLRGLQFNFSCLGGFDGAVKAVSTPNEGPQIYAVILREAVSPYRVFSGNMQFSRPTTSSIWIHPIQPEDMKEWRIPLALLPDENGIGGIWPDQIVPLEAARIAELFAKDIVERIDP